MSHSCTPNCQAVVMAASGKLTIALYTLRQVLALQPREPAYLHACPPGCRQRWTLLHVLPPVSRLQVIMHRACRGW